MTVLALVFLSGVILGGLYFGGLWLTVRKLPQTHRPAQLFLLSFLLRTSLVLAGFYLLMAASWQRLLAALLGFILARMIMTRHVALSAKTPGGEHGFKS